MYPIFYREEMAVEMPGHISQSTLKPKVFTESMKDDVRFCIESFSPISDASFRIAHTEDYVSDLLNNGKLADTSWFDWSEPFLDSLRYTVGSLEAAIRSACERQSLSVAPVSGFHHAKPEYGSMYCAVSGQVIASVDLYRERRIAGAYVDLDAHRGNSIEDTYKFCYELYDAVPRGMNINPTPVDNIYMSSLERSLKRVRRMLDDGKIQYVVLCHGADSCIGDKMDGFLTKDQWLQAGELVAEYVRGYPMVYTLFGGYRDRLEDVVALHKEGLNRVLDAYL